MDTGITDRYVYFRVAVVSNEPFTTSIEERFCVFRLGPCLEYLLMVEDNCAV